MIAKRLHHCILKSDRFIIHTISRVAVCSYVIGVLTVLYKRTCNELVFAANTAYDGLLDRDQELTANRAYLCEREC
jgi:hypothetical protein